MVQGRRSVRLGVIGRVSVVRRSGVQLVSLQGLLNMKGRDKVSLLHFGLQPESSRAFSFFLQVNVSMHL